MSGKKKTRWRHGIYEKLSMWHLNWFSFRGHLWYLVKLNFLSPRRHWGIWRNNKVFEVWSLVTPPFPLKAESQWAKLETSTDPISCQDCKENWFSLCFSVFNIYQNHLEGLFKHIMLADIARVCDSVDTW